MIECPDIIILLAFNSSTSQDNPSDKDINQGTLVVFNLDPSVSNEDLRQIFGAYGEVKEVIILSFLAALYPCHVCVYVFYILSLRLIINVSADKGNSSQEASQVY